jgi:hypothetical protein
LSLCCSRDGCRRRMTPPSVRFLGRRVYLGAVLVLVSAMQQGSLPGRRVRPGLGAQPLMLALLRECVGRFPLGQRSPFQRLVADVLFHGPECEKVRRKVEGQHGF